MTTGRYRPAHRHPNPAGPGAICRRADQPGLPDARCPTSRTRPSLPSPASAHDALHDAVDLIEALSQHADVAISTLHTLDGDPAAWATLAAHEGFLDCAITDSTLADLITHN